MAAGKPEQFVFEKVGDSISGEIDAIGSVTTDYGTSAVLDVISSDDGEVYSVAMFGGVLSGKMETLRPQVGMTIAIRYEGKKPSKVSGHADYKDYWVLVDEGTRPATAPASIALAATPPAPSYDEGAGEEPF